VDSLNPPTTVSTADHAELQLNRLWIQLGAVGIVACYLYAGIVSHLVWQWWNDPDFSHGFFVPIFAALVVWQRRRRLAQIKLAPSWTGFLIVAFALALLIVGVLGAELFLSRTSLIFLLAGAIVVFAGWDFFKALIFPWAVLFLMVPIPAILFNKIPFPLQFLASQLATSLLSLVGVPVLRDGNVIQLPALSLEVVQACSGIRSLLSLGTLAIIYGYFAEKSVLKRTVLAIMAIPIAVAANALRIMGTGLLGQYWDPDKAQGFFHEFSGWLIFVLSVIMLFVVHRLISMARRPHGQKPASA
jgi:exosortase